MIEWFRLAKRWCRLFTLFGGALPNYRKIDDTDTIYRQDIYYYIKNKLRIEIKSLIQDQGFKLILK